MEENSFNFIIGTLNLFYNLISKLQSHKNNVEEVKRLIYLKISHFYIYQWDRQNPFGLKVDAWLARK